MKGDFTRSTFAPEKHYSGVRMQQGRVQIDADWNEQLDIQAHRDRTEAIDVIGACGVPKGDGGFLVGVSGDGGDLTIAAGRIYVDGILCENGAPATLAEQPDLPGALPLGDAGAAAGAYLVYLDVWEQHVTALEDPSIREVALGGPDTATRARTVWQVRLLRVGDTNDDIDCDSPLPGWDALVGRPLGRLSARAQPEAPASGPCIIEPGAGYRRLENQLYRVEIHDGSASGQPTFKWSRENGSVVTAWLDRSGDNLTVSGLGRDKPLGFAAGQWVELTDDARELRGEPGTLVQLLRAEGQTLTVDAATATGTLDWADFPRNPKVRRWDFTPAPATLRVEVPAADGGWLALEDGVQVRFVATDTYATGDHWLIPARTATGNVEWPFSEPQEPRGVSHHYCRLALVRYDGAPIVAADIIDCRPQFPSLTTICAEDICYDDTNCRLGDGEELTVQDALDRLCAERDLRHHNKHLHGWGIVCGLQVTCGPNDPGRPREFVTIHDGYAIDCEGNDILVEQDERFPMLEAILQYDERNANARILDERGNGEACLILSSNPRTRGRYVVSRYDSATADNWQTLLAGTLLMDFYNDCIKPIQDFLQKQLTPPENERDLPAGPGHQRVAALTNLLAQPINPQTGQHIYISPREHAILLEFYNGLRELLRSETFCAMFENARPFPDYPLRELGIEEGELNTMFGRSQHVRIRVRPGAREIYTVGSGLNPARPSTTINRYDLERGVLVEQIDPVAGAKADAKNDTGAGSVQDVAFSQDGNLIYMVAATKNDENTFFRVGEIGRTGITWRPVVTICGVKLVTLATTLADKTNVYAIGLTKVTTNNRTEFRGAGLYKINPDNVDPNMGPIVEFNAFGNLEISADGRAFATFNTQNVQPTSYNAVKMIKLPEGGVVQDIALELSGRDDIALFTVAEQAKPETLFVVLGPDGNNLKYIQPYRIDNGRPSAERAQVPNTTIRLEPFAPTRMLLITLENNYSVRMMNMDTGALVDGYLLPTQVSPVAIASDMRVARGRLASRTARVYVLNYVSNTVTVAAGRLFNPQFRFNLKALADYRKGVVEAFTDLTGGFLQYVKDCLCDHFLVRCPECAEDEPIYLACVSIRERQVYKVCNFSRRRYVKSFPTVGYWLSLVPIVPIIDRLIEQFCCMVLPELFGRYKVAEYDEERSTTGRAGLGGEQLRQALGLLQGLDVAAGLREFTNRFSSASRNVGAAGEQPTFVRPLAQRPTMVSSSIIDQPVETTEAELKQRGVLVRRATYDPASAPGLVSDLAGLLRQPRPGRAVTLYEEGGRVRYYTVSEAEPAAELQEHVANLTRSAQARDEELRLLRGQSEAHGAALAEVAPLKATLAERNQEIATLRRQVQELESKQTRLEAGPTNARVVALETELQELRTFREEVTKFMKRQKP